MGILQGLKNQSLADRRLRTGEVSLVEAERVMIDGTNEINNFYAGLIGQETPATTSLDASASDRCESDASALRFGLQNDRFIDANIGLPLDEGLCRAARKKDIDYFKSKGVWEIRPMNEARESRWEKHPYQYGGYRSTKATTNRPTSEADLWPGKVAQPVKPRSSRRPRHWSH